MKQRVRFFASHRDAVGKAELEMVTEEGATVRSVFEELARRYPALGILEGHTMAAVNLKAAGWTAELADGDELAFYPPVSGG
jgi:MoaD family protein